MRFAAAIAALKRRRNRYPLRTA
ncbi:hypothetical protein A2U01_0055479, partial [Trifolium medium]|nr:hypothetical protein [Trifolium medium]